MRTKSIGEVLKDERLAHRFPLEKLSKQTRIRLEYLSALESNQFEKLPAATFVKGYIKTYASVFGFDHQPVLALLRRDYRESAKGTLVPREFIKPVLKPRMQNYRVTALVVAAMFVFFTLLGYVGVQWYYLQQPPSLAVTAPEDHAKVSATVQILGRTDLDATVHVNQEPVALQPDGSFQSQISIPKEGIAFIEVTAVDRRGKTSSVLRTVTVEF
ncbi:MAG: helix-turn-helix domain-containing protein [Microgenomates group bacterium]